MAVLWLKAVLDVLINMEERQYVQEGQGAQL